MKKRKIASDGSVIFVEEDDSQNTQKRQFTPSKTPKSKKSKGCSNCLKPLKNK